MTHPMMSLHAVAGQSEEGKGGNKGGKGGRGGGSGGGGGGVPPPRAAEGPTRAMRLAASLRAQTQAAIDKRVEATRKAFAPPPPPPSDAEWEERVGETLRGVPKRRVHQIFEAFDTDSSGRIEAEEFLEGMRELGLKELPDDAGLRIFQSHDAGGDGHLDRQELLRLLTNAREPRVHLRRVQKARLGGLQWRNPFEVFAEFDISGNGVLTMQELTGAFERRVLSGGASCTVVSVAVAGGVACPAWW